MERSKLNTQIYEEACEWFIECRAGDLNETARYEFDRWLRKSPEHFSAYLEIAAIWNEAPSLDSAAKYDRQTLITQAALERDNIVVLSTPLLSTDTSINSVELQTARWGVPNASLAAAQGHSASHRVRTRFWRRRLGSIAASIAALVLVVCGLVWVETRQAFSYATAIGEQRSLELADGSTVALNSRSKIRVHFSDRERDVELLAGQALFHVAKDPARPFIVRSGATQVRAVGTEFDVYQKRDDTVVTVVEGRVAVLANHPVTNSDDASSTIVPLAMNSAPPSSSTLPFPEAGSGRAGNMLVSAGEQLTVTPNRLQKSDHANIASATAWTQRQLIFESASLSEVAEEFNRYNRRQLVIADPGLDFFHISGVFSSTDPASLIRFLRARPGLRIVETTSEMRIEKNNP